MGQPQQVVAGGPGRLQRRGVQQRSNMVQRVPQAPVRPPADQRAAFLGRVQAEDHPHRGGLPRAIGADESGHLPRSDGEGHPVQCQRRPEAFAQASYLDGCFFFWMAGEAATADVVVHVAVLSFWSGTEGTAYPGTLDDVASAQGCGMVRPGASWPRLNMG
jgi:hypothetical protein